MCFNSGIYFFRYRNIWYPLAQHSTVNLFPPNLLIHGFNQNLNPPDVSTKETRNCVKFNFLPIFTWEGLNTSHNFKPHPVSPLDKIIRSHILYVLKKVQKISFFQSFVAYKMEKNLSCMKKGKKRRKKSCLSIFSPHLKS